MDNLYIDYEEASILGTKVLDKSKKLKEMLDSLDEIQKKINSNIDNINNSELTARLNIMYKLADVVTETGNFMVNVSSAYKEAAESFER